jgi:hypothetical protein
MKLEARRANPSLNRRRIQRVPEFRKDQKHAGSQAGIELARDELLSSISSSHRRATAPDNQDLIPTIQKPDLFAQTTDHKRKRTHAQSPFYNETTLRIRTMSDATTDVRTSSGVNKPPLKLKNMLQP